MSFTPPVARSSSLLAVILSLLIPSAALADTFTVDPLDGNKACGGADKVCPTIQSAVDAAGGGDLISVIKGTYAEAVTVPKSVTIKGAGVGDVKVTGAGTADVFTISGDDVVLTGLTVDVPANAGSAVAVTADATNAQLTGLVAQRATASDQNVATVEVAGAAQVLQSLVVQSIGTAGTPAIASTGAGGTLVADTVAISSVGPAAVFSASEANQLLRSTLASTEASSDAVRVLSTNAGARKLVADSAIMVGGASAAGALAKSSGASAGTIALDFKHVTITGSAKGIVVDAQEADGPGLPTPAPSGSIDAKVVNSIVHGASSAEKNNPTPLLEAPNTAKLTFTTSDINDTSGDGEIVKTATTTTADAALFAKNLRLRADSPVIDKGTAGVSGSSKDVEGEPRTNGAAPDLGADEFVNKPPRALFGITDKSPRQRQAIGFVSGSSDPEQDAGGGIVEWRWDFGDGTKETTKVGGVAHTYENVGSYNVTLQVVDRQGAASAVTAPQVVTVRDGTAPDVTITAPVNGAKLRLTRTTRVGKRKRTRALPLTILGTVKDTSGVQSVEVSLMQTKRDPVRKKRARRSQAAKRCWHYSGRVFARKACTNEIWLKPTIKGTVWSLATRRGLKLRPGLYEIRARATDTTGLLSGAFSTAAKTLVKFRVR